jgi:UrcA family protein
MEFAMSLLSRSFLFGGAALALLAALPAQAQERTTYTKIVSGAPERVDVFMPHDQRSEIGAPIEYRTVSRAVRFDDLDLTTRQGARELRDRVRRTARELCRRPEFSIAVAPVNGPACYGTAVEEAMDQVDNAIAQARRG